MPTQTASQDQWTYEDLYNMLMDNIEPELCTFNLDMLDELYQGETEKERKARYEHYGRCLVLLMDAITELNTLAKHDILLFQKNVIGDVEKRIAMEEKEKMEGIEKSINESE